jgi:hypothetical protein
MIDELERIWEEAVMTWDVSGGTRKTTKNLPG